MALVGNREHPAMIIRHATLTIMHATLVVFMANKSWILPEYCISHLANDSGFHWLRQRLRVLLRGKESNVDFEPYLRGM